MKHRDFIENLRIVLKWGIASGLIYTTFALGGVRIWGYLPLSMLGIVLYLLAVTRLFCMHSTRFAESQDAGSFWKRIFHPDLRGPFFIPVVILLSCAILQIIPFPREVVGLLSPATLDLQPEYLKQMEIPEILMTDLDKWFNNKTWLTFSTYPHKTGLFIFYLLGVFAIHPVIRLHLASSRTRIYLVNTIISLGGILAVIGIMNRILAILARVKNISDGLNILWFLPVLDAPHSFGTFVNRNHFAGFMVMCIPLGLAMVIRNRRRTRHLRKYYLAATAVMIVALLMTLSRGGILGFVISMLIFITAGKLAERIQFKQIAWISAAVILILIIFAASGNALLTRFYNLPEIDLFKSGYYRLDCWLGALKILYHFPVLGVGLANFSSIYPMYKETNAQLLFTNAENDYLQLVAETGIFGVVTLFLFLLLFYRIFKNVMTKFVEGETSIVRFAAGTGCLGYLLHSFVDYHFYIPANFLLFVILVSFVTIPYTQGYRHREYGKFPVSSHLVWIAIFWVAGIILLIKMYDPLRSYSHERKFYYWNQRMTQSMKNEGTREEYFLKAEKEIMDASLLEPNNATYNSQMALLYQKQAGILGDRKQYIYSNSQNILINKAINSILKSIINNPVQWQYHIDLAWLGVYLPGNKQIEEAFQQAIKLNPTNGRGYYNYATYLSDNLEIEKSMEMFRKTIELSPNRMNDYLQTYLRKETELGILLKGIPEDPDLLWNTAKYLENVNRLEDSTQVSLMSLKMNKKLGVLLSRADKIQLKEKTAAVEIYTKSLNSYGSNETAIAGLIKCSIPENIDAIAPLLKEYHNLFQWNHTTTEKGRMQILESVAPLKDRDPSIAHYYDLLSDSDYRSIQEEEYVPSLNYKDLEKRKKKISKILAYNSDFEIEIQLIPSVDNFLLFCRIWGGKLERGDDFIRNPYLTISTLQNTDNRVYPIVFGSFGSVGVVRAPVEKYFTLPIPPENLKIRFGFEYYSKVGDPDQSGGPYEIIIFPG